MKYKKIIKYNKINLLYIQKKQVISILDIYNNTFVYFPLNIKEPVFFQTDTGFLIRDGLTIFSLPIKLSSKNNKSKFIHLSIQQNSVFKIIKRGMPKLYEYNLNPKLKKLNSNKFDEYLLQNLKKLYENTKIPIINIKQIKIKSTIFFLDCK